MAARSLHVARSLTATGSGGRSGGCAIDAGGGLRVAEVDL
jgi:hypothetical protein